MARRKSEAARRRRIERLKKIIVIVVTLSILIPWLICAILLVRIHFLKEKIEAMQTEWEASNVETEEDFGSSEPDSTQTELETSGELESHTEETYAVIAMAGEKEMETVPEDDGVKRIYLTFDDGPSSNTDEILDILDQYDIKATFFVVGKEDEMSLASYRRIVEEGHTLGMHSYSHLYSEIYDSKEAFIKDLEKLRTLLTDATGIQPKYYRFPGGSSNTVSKTNMYELIDCLHEQGMEYYDWNVASGDAMSKMPSEEMMVDNVVKNAPMFHQAMVLFHDASNKPQTVKALPTIIETLMEQGYQFYAINNQTKPVQHLKTEE